MILLLDKKDIVKNYPINLMNGENNILIEKNNSSTFISTIYSSLLKLNSDFSNIINIHTSYLFMNEETFNLISNFDELNIFKRTFNNIKIEKNIEKLTIYSQYNFQDFTFENLNEKNYKELYYMFPLKQKAKDSTVLFQMELGMYGSDKLNDFLKETTVKFKII
jgi:hypothetical protein